ncbi:PREDICTED: relaxin-3-like [Miniopterus natalensis]|uniref:relaxin-3-like n=1 Tax=Miniopterus natalensis TaxID=291302 RepID=UPI0007A7103A|nr:PREDICTED: relaxin-3-like [Miniopterus natalensis]
MANHPLLLLLALWMLAGGLWLEAEAQEAPDEEVKLCDTEFIRRMFASCGILLKRSVILAREAIDAESDADSQLEEAVASLIKLGQKGTPGVLRHRRGVVLDLHNKCCNLGCHKSELRILC